MKKFISFVMAAAMVASLVPATAFAASGEVTATAKVVNAWTENKDFNGVVNGTDVPELQLKVTSVDYEETTGAAPRAEITVTLDNAEFANDFGAADVTLNVGTAWAPGVDTTTYSYSAAFSRAQVIAAIEDVLLNGSDDYIWVRTADAGTQNNAARKYVDALNLVWLQTNANAALAENFVSVVDQAWADFETYKANFNVIGGTAVNALYTYNAATQSFVEKGNTAAQDVVTIAEVAAAAGKTGYTVTLNAAPIADAALAAATGGFSVVTETATTTTGAAGVQVTGVRVSASDRSEATITLRGWFEKDDIISIDLRSVLDKATKNATVSVESDDIVCALDDAVYVNVADKAATASVKKTVALAEEEITNLHSDGLKVKEVVAGSFAANDVVSLKLSKGLEFTNGQRVVVNGVAPAVTIDGNEIEFVITRAMLGAGFQNTDGLVTLTIGVDTNGVAATLEDGLRVESTSAKAGTVGTVTVKVGNLDKVVVDVVEIVDYKVMMTVDEDEDVPVIYSGVNVNNDGITDDSDHETLEITLEETFPGAWSSRQGFDITVPDGVYVTDVRIVDTENFFINEQSGLAAAREMTAANWLAAFTEAYQDGDHKNFEFGKRVFDDVDVTLPDDVASLTFVLELVADPGFEGDVEIGFEGALVDTQSVVAAKFVAPYTVTAEQNDLKIDSRYTSIPTDIVVKETADGLWDDRTAAIFVLGIEKGLISFEDDATFTVDKDSELDIDDDLVAYNGVADSALLFEVTDTSDKAATVTISDMELFMERNIPAGAYALELTTSMSAAYDRQILFANEDPAPVWGANNNVGDNFVDDVTDYSNVVKDKFINVITAPRDEDGFTTKITVPVGESYIIAGEVKVEIDTPAYINANGYTMLPLRAVAVALGIDNNSVLWDQSTRTATILYGNRVVSMQNGAKVMYINGQAVATKAGVEITNDRTFLSLRDLGTAMNVTDISWDAATRTAYLNAGVTEEA